MVKILDLEADLFEILKRNAMSVKCIFSQNLPQKIWAYFNEIRSITAAEILSKGEKDLNDLE